jgi:hypothetical protein
MVAPNPSSIIVICFPSVPKRGWVHVHRAPSLTGHVIMMCGSSVWNLLPVTLLAPVWRCLLGFRRIRGPLLEVIYQGTLWYVSVNSNPCCTVVHIKSTVQRRVTLTCCSIRSSTSPTSKLCQWARSWMRSVLPRPLYQSVVFQAVEKSHQKQIDRKGKKTFGWPFIVLICVVFYTSEYVAGWLA